MNKIFNLTIFIKISLLLIIICVISIFGIISCNKNNKITDINLSSATIQMKTLFDLTNTKSTSPLDGSKYTLKISYPLTWESNGNGVFTSNSQLAMIIKQTVRKINYTKNIEKDAYKLIARDDSYNLQNTKIITNKTNSGVQYILYKSNESNGYNGEVIILFDNSFLINFSIGEEINKSIFEAMINSVQLEYNK